MPTETNTVRNASWAVSPIGTPAGLSNGGRLVVLSNPHTANIGKSEMRKKLLTHRIDDDPWVMGVLEPILLLLFIAVIGALLRLL